MDEILAPDNWTLSEDPSDRLEPELSLAKKLQLIFTAVLLTFLVNVLNLLFIIFISLRSFFFLITVKLINQIYLNIISLNEHSNRIDFLSSIFLITQWTTRQQKKSIGQGSPQQGYGKGAQVVFKGCKFCQMRYG